MAFFRGKLLIAALLAVGIPTTSEAMFRRCIDRIAEAARTRLFSRTFAEFVGAPTSVVEPDWHNRDFFDLEPEFDWIREGLQIYIVERHSGVRFYRDSRTLYVRLPTSTTVLTERISLTEKEEILFESLATYKDLADLHFEERDDLVEFFRKRICERLFHRAVVTIEESEAESVRHLVSSAAAKWSLKDDGRFIGYQVEGWLDEKGRVITYGAPTSKIHHWAITQVYLRDGVVEIRAFRADDSEKGYRYIRFPIGDILGNEGQLKSSLELMCLNQYQAVTESGHHVNGKRFPGNHQSVSRAVDLGLDPENNYQPYDYREKVVYFKKGSFEGQTGVVRDQRVTTPNSIAGTRHDLWIEISGHSTPLQYSNAFIVPVDLRLLAAGTDLVTREPFSFGEGDAVFLKATGERGNVVERRESNYLVEFDSRPGERQSFVIGELIPARYFHPALLQEKKVPSAP